MSIHSVELGNLASHIARSRDDLLGAWRQAVLLDPTLTTGASLPRDQLHDHIPALPEDFERRLAADLPKEQAQAECEQKGDAAAHGLHRWQQGFDLAEVTRELGRLNECVVVELESYAVEHPSLHSGVMAEARKIWAQLCSVAISSSTSQFFKLQQLEAWVQGTGDGVRQPDLTIWFDLPPAIAAQRRAQARAADRFEQQDVEYFERVRAGYAARADAAPQRFVRIDAALDRDAVWRQIDAALGARGW